MGNLEVVKKVTMKNHIPKVKLKIPKSKWSPAFTFDSERCTGDVLQSPGVQEPDENQAAPAFVQSIEQHQGATAIHRGHAKEGTSSTATSQENGKMVEAKPRVLRSQNQTTGNIPSGLLL